MAKDLRNIFYISHEKENTEEVIENIKKDIFFRGARLWILIFAIVIASLGLNLNSTAVIIGAMLISPIMGPILGAGLGLGIRDFALVKRSLKNYSFAVFVSITASFIYFLSTPLTGPISELLARTSPSIYDVLIAFFGGLAGILANSTNTKGNIIPGVAIATALLPPLCTAGYGLATFQLNFFLGAFYLFTINTVFIALATMLTVRFLRFPMMHRDDEKASVHSRHYVMVIVLVTIIPSLFLSWRMIKEDQFRQSAEKFSDNFTYFEDNYLLDRKIDAQKKKITLIYGGKTIPKIKIDSIQNQLSSFGIKDADLEIKQGISFHVKTDEESILRRINQLTSFLSQRDSVIDSLKSFSDSLDSLRKISENLLAEAIVYQPKVQMISLDPVSKSIIVKSKRKLTGSEQKKLKQWINIRLKEMAQFDQYTVFLV